MWRLCVNVDENVTMNRNENSQGENKNIINKHLTHKRSEHFYSFHVCRNPHADDTCTPLRFCCCNMESAF